jgi:hypothetical protein
MYTALGVVCNHNSSYPSGMSGSRRTGRQLPTSILARLASRSVTGRDSPLQVHQHGNADLLLMWGDSCVRRRFAHITELNAFCSDLLQGVGVYSCVLHPHPLPHHVELCLHTNRKDALWEKDCGVCFKSFSSCRCTDPVLWPRGTLYL